MKKNATTSAKNMLENLQSAEEENSESCFEKLIIEPENPNKRLFDLLISFCILFDFVFASYVFFINDEYMVAVHIFSGVFALDILLRFIQGYYQGTQRIMSPKTIAINYIWYFLYLT